MPWFHSDDEALAEYNGRKITVLDEWDEQCVEFVSHVVDILFEDGTRFTCQPQEVRDVHPYAEQFRCKECGNLWLYVTDHKPDCSCHPNVYLHLSGPALN